MQLEAPVVEISPAGHGLQTEFPDKENVPAEHILHDEIKYTGVDANVPDGQLTQVVRSSFEYCPGEQNVQESEPSEDEIEPFWHV